MVRWLDGARLQEVVEHADDAIVSQHLSQRSKVVLVVADHCLIALDDEVSPLAVLVWDRVHGVCVNEEASIRLDLNDRAVLLVHVDLVTSNDVLQRLIRELLLVALGHPHKEGVLHATVEVAKNVAIGLLGSEAAAVAHESLNDLPHGAFAAALLPNQADHDTHLLVRMLEGVREQIEQEVVGLRLAAAQHLEVLQEARQPVPHGRLVQISFH